MLSDALVGAYAPVAAWLAIGVSLGLASRRSASPTVFRLSAVFLGAWALFATTALAYVLANGGWAALVALARTPSLLFGTRSVGVWIAGALGAFAVFFVAFLLSQAVGRGFLRLYPSRELPWPARVPEPATATTLRAFDAPGEGAFAFTLLERGGGRGVRARDVIMISEGLLGELDPHEWEAVIAHELGHLRELDGRYLTFFRTLSRMMRWDPILAYFAESLTRREEFRADLDAVELTHRPRALARALYKATALPASFSSPSLPGLLGVGGRRGRRQAVERIRRLVALAESGRFPEESGA
ncbi:MAG TPA: M48 family metalloprotease [Thermoplasmata archaeon]|jgi:Zn-dependent protease with chaperone function|nr:M48 family metalloprotease [Thermoplasmata archaeon]